MTSHEHDPAQGDGQPQEPLDLHALRAAFHELPTPDATPPLDESDAQTRAAVAWMVDAFAALSVPDVSVPKLTTRAPRRTLLRRLPGLRPRTASSPAPWMRHAAAAAIFAALALALNWGRSDELATGTSPGSRSPTAHVDEPAVRKAIPGFRAAPKTGTGLLATADGQLELRSGPVRLVLLTSNFAPDPAAPPR